MTAIPMSRLLEDLSRGLPEVSDDELDAIADERELEMERDASSVVSHDDMLRFLSGKRR